MTTTNKYEQQAEDFLTKTKTTIEIEYIGHGMHFDDDKQTRDIYRFTIKKGERKYTATFGQSIVNSGTATADHVFTDDYIRMGRPYPNKDGSDYKQKRKAPRAYDILSCLTKSDPGTFEDFCADFGYNTDSRKAEKVYFAVQKEFKGVCSIWNEAEREQLADIQ